MFNLAKSFLMEITNLDLTIFVIAILFLLSYNSKSIYKNSNFYKVLSLILMCATIIIVSDVINYDLTKYSSLHYASLRKIFYTTSFVSLQILPLFWLYYVVCELNISIKITKLKLLFYASPMIVLIILSLTSPWTGLMFYVSNSNQYFRGPLYILHSIFPAIYVLCAAGIAFKQYFKEILPDRKKMCLNLMLYSIIPAIGGALQITSKGSVYLPLSIVISVDMMYLYHLKRETILDPLTKLNNKLQFNSFLEQKVVCSSTANLCVLFFDMNNFKSVNDDFGHLEGDKAIIAVAGVISSTFNDMDAFCARCGGDEFGVVATLDNVELNSRIDKVHFKLKELSKCKPYILSVSIGYAYYDNNYSTATDMIKAADANMYENKNKMKNLNDLSAQPS